MTDQPGSFSDKLIGAFNEAHANADTDDDVDSLHHTLGLGGAQAAPGTHDHGLSTYKSYTPRVESGGADWVYNPGDAIGRYQIIGNQKTGTMFFSVWIKAAPTSGPGVFVTKIYLPDRVQMGPVINQVAPCLYFIGSAPPGISNQGLGIGFFAANANFFYVLIFGGGATAQVAGGNGLQQLILTTNLEVVKL